MPSTRWACVTELESVNTLLAIIGEAPISQFSDLEANEITDSALAQRTLVEVANDVQAEGWSFNTDEIVNLQPDEAGEYVIPGNALRVDFSPNRYANCPYVVRGKRIWDRLNQTHKIASTEDPQVLVVDQMVVRLDWDDLPHTAQQYITIRAGRIYSDRFINSNVIFTYTAQDEEYARAQLIRAEESTLFNNMLWGNDSHSGQGFGFVPAQGRMYRRN